MSTATASSSILEQIHHEHERLEFLIAEIRWVLIEPSELHLRLFKGLMGELVPLLEDHFAHEEEGGYFAELIEIAPELSERVEQLRLEHGEMLATVRAINSRLQFADSTPNWFSAIRSDFTDFLQRCEAHQHEENAMAQEGYLRDTGAGD